MAIRNVYVYTKTNLGAPLENALVRIYDNTFAFQSEGYTNSQGRSGPFLINDGVIYISPQLDGYSFPGLPYTSTISADISLDTVATKASNPATDGNFCRVWGSIKHPNNTPVRKPGIRFSLLQDIVRTTQDVVVGDILIRGNDNGYVSVDLLRNAWYMTSLPNIDYPIRFIGDDSLMMQGFMPQPRKVPNSAELQLADFLFPIPSRVSFSTPNLAILVDEQNTDALLTVIMSNGCEASYIDPTTSVEQATAMKEMLSFSSDDTNIAEISVDDSGNITVLGVAPGTASITVTRDLSGYMHYPNPPQLIVDTFEVTVS